MKRIFLCLALVAALVGCGGSSDSPPPAPPAPTPPPAIGADGGSVDQRGVATVVVPPGALSTPTTIRIAQDSTGAPSVPAWFAPVGPMVAITPHGAAFAEPVTVRLPAPDVTLVPGERLLIAKAQPGGEWEVYSETERRDGQLEVKVRSLSIFAAVKVRGGSLPLSQIVTPFQMGPLSLACDGRLCGSTERLRAMTITATTSGNGGELPAGCSSPEIEFRGGLSTSSSPVPSDFIGSNLPIDGAGAFERSFPMPTVSPSGSRALALAVMASLVCTDATTRAKSRLQGPIVALPVDLFSSAPSVPLVREFPSALTGTSGQDVTLKAVLSGGVSFQTGPATFQEPLSVDPPVLVYIERQRAGESVWTPLRSLKQIDMNPSPYGGPRWMYWGFEMPWSLLTGSRLTAADNNASLRLRACLPLTPTANPQYDCIIGPVARLTVLQQALPPEFTLQPRSVLVQPGQTASLSAQVTGTPMPTLQWQQRSSGPRGAWTNVTTNGNAANYTTPVISLADNGVQYRLVATNSAGTVVSDIAIISVDTALIPPSITSEPQSLTVVRGSEAVFAVNATGTEALSYQWFKGGATITAANAPQLKIANVTDADSGLYAVQITNAAGKITSAAAQLTVTAAQPTEIAPSIVTQPAAVTITAGNVATFAVGANGTSPMTFQWRKDGVDIPGANAAAYTLAAVSQADSGSYSVRVQNGAGSVVSQAAALTVLAAPVTPVPQAPTIVAQPRGIIVAPGMGATLAVSANGTGPLAYQWLRDGVPVAGQTGAVLTIAAAGALDAGSYRVQVSNSAGAVTSDAAQVILLGAPAITTQPASTSVTEGATATFGVAATGDALRYQWTRNSVAIAGATAASYTTPALVFADSGAVYGVVVFNGAGLVFSSGAVVTVTPAPRMAILAGNFNLGGGGGASDGVGTQARFDFPEGLTADGAGNLYVAQTNGDRVARIAPTAVVTTIYNANVDGRVLGSSNVGSVAVGPGGDLFAAAVSGCGLYRIGAPASASRSLAIIEPTGCSGSEVRGVAVDGTGRVHLSFSDSHTIFRGGAAPVGGGQYPLSVLAGPANTTNGAGYLDATGGAARFNAPRGIAFAANGDLFVADSVNHVIRKVTPLGVVSTVAGSAGQADSVDGTGPAARFNAPTDLAFDAAGNLVVLERGAFPPAIGTVRVRRITPAGEVTTLFNATAEAVALAAPGEEGNAAIIRGIAVLDSNRIALSAGNAILVRTLP